ncbi:MAG TPA: Wzt carbohydrate-binding domain-containing protein, partial [Solirubrobacteraceae bacterium]|nr:Wzt carbohydrate-binding domain-containing protein [Solirubrobacteraceae bacterium]
MAPFIELGVGFNPDLTAHDNVLINAVMLGLTPDEARARHDSIMDFAELHEFAELKLKNYSSGMQVRLAFSVMVHVDADRLLIDEVLAVGDAAFQQKCFDVLSRAREEGRTMLLVTHDMDQVQRFCDRALLLDRGNVVAVDEPRAVARQYMRLNFAGPGADPAEGPATARVRAGRGRPLGDGRVVVVDAWAQDLEGRKTVLPQREPTGMAMRVQFGREVADPVFTFVLTDEHRRRVLVLATDAAAGEAYDAGYELDVTVVFENHLAPGRYWITVHVTEGDDGGVLALREDIYSFVVTGDSAGGGLVTLPHTFALTPAPSMQEAPG